MSDSSRNEMRLEELLVEQTDRALTYVEAAELRQLLRASPDWSEDDLELAAAASFLAIASAATARDPALPAALEARILSQAQAELATEQRAPRERSDTVPRARVPDLVDIPESAKTLETQQPLLIAEMPELQAALERSEVPQSKQGRAETPRSAAKGPATPKNLELETWPSPSQPEPETWPMPPQGEPETWPAPPKDEPQTLPMPVKGEPQTLPMPTKGEPGTLPMSPRGHAARSESPGSQAARSESPRSQAARSDAARSDTPPSQATRSESPRSQAARSDAPRGETPRSHAAQNEPPRSQAARSESPRSQAARSDAPRGETPRSLAAQNEPPRSEIAAAPSPGGAQAPGETGNAWGSAPRGTIASDATKITPAPKVDNVVSLSRARIAIISLSIAASIALAALGATIYLAQTDSGIDRFFRDNTPLTSLRKQLLDRATDTVTLPWSAASDPLGKPVTGDVVWSNSRQEGFMRFLGLAKNDLTKLQYQLWIFDADRDERYPVDGGVFDVDADTGEVIVRINPKIKVSKATLFAVTAEPPGGVVVSTRERLVVIAKVL